MQPSLVPSQSAENRGTSLGYWEILRSVILSAPTQGTPDSVLPWKNDSQFEKALLAGPLCWALLAFWMYPLADLTWPLNSPGPYLLVALIYPAVEEFVFRGNIQPYLRQHAPWGERSLAGLTVANILTSLLFAGLYALTHPFLWAVLAIVPSLIFGYFRDRDQSLRKPILLHVAYNSGYFWLFGL
jgi:uncharacterized protein